MAHRPLIKSRKQVSVMGEKNRPNKRLESQWVPCRSWITFKITNTGKRNKTLGSEKCVRMSEKDKSHLLALGTSLSSE